MTPEQYLASVDLSSTPRGHVEQGAADPDAAVFDQARTQAQVVGAGVFSFAPGVEVAVREAVSDALLLAQLVANKHASAEADPLRWFAAYTEVLADLGYLEVTRSARPVATACGEDRVGQTHVGSCGLTIPRTESREIKWPA